MYYTVIKHDEHLRIRRKCRKHEPQVFLSVLVCPEHGLSTELVHALACVYRVMDARGKFGEYKGSVRIARGDSREHL